MGFASVANWALFSGDHSERLRRAMRASTARIFDMTETEVESVARAKGVERAERARAEGTGAGAGDGHERHSGGPRYEPFFSIHGTTVPGTI